MIKEQGMPQEAFRLSAQQRRLWLAQGEQGQAFRSACTVRIEGGLHVEALREALEVVVERHEILRTTFHRRRGMKVPFQVVAPEALVDWAEAKDPSRAHAATPSPPFDYEQGPLFRAGLTAEPGAHVLHLELPALCCDLRGLENLVGEIAAAYEACAVGGDLPAEPLQYADYADWQEEQLASGGEPSALGTPRDLAATLKALRLPWQREPGAAAFEPRSRFLQIEPELAGRLETLAASHGGSLTAVLLAVWQILIWRLTCQPEIVVGVRCNGREAEDLEGAVGLYDWWAPAALALTAERSFEEILEQTESALREADTGRPFGPDSRAEPLFFPIGFELHELAGPRSAAGVTFMPEELHACCEPCGLKLAAFRNGRSLRLELHHDGAGLTEDAAARLEQQLLTLLRAAVDEPGACIGDLAILGAAEREMLLATVNDTAVEHGGSRRIDARFEEQAARHAEKTAIAFEGERISYGELNVRANRLAHFLRELGVGPEVRVALLLERSPEVIVSLLAVLKAGGAYVPLDPVYPRERLALMLEDSGAKVLLTCRALAEGLEAAGARAVLLDVESGTIGRHAERNPAQLGGDDNLAYVLFTSGSTGRPKGVAVEHRHLAHYVDGILNRIGLPPGLGFAAMSTFAADLGHTALFPALLTGGRFHLISQEEGSNPDLLGRRFEDGQIDGLKIVPSHLAALLAAAGDPARVLPRRVLVLGGEACRWDLVERVRRAAPGLEVWNHYGPTETTVGAIAGRAGDRPQELWAPATAPIGGPLPNVQVYVLDARLHPVPLGVPGEIYLGGQGVARGYLDRPEQTAERFVPDSFAGRRGARRYRTGDLARFLPTGAIEFLGRIDHQVKVRGFRIELGEIEAALIAHPAVAETAVIATDGAPGERRLVAYVVPRRGQQPGQDELRALLARRLPEYMIPAVFVTLPGLPLTPNGKVDRAGLPAPERASSREAAGYAPPRHPAEAALARIWAEVLGLEKVGIHDNFFQLGGDSILCIEVIARAARAGLRFTPRQIFQHQTIAELAAEIGNAPAADAEQGIVSGEAPLTPIQRWFFEQEIEEAHHWNQAVLLKAPAAGPPALAEAALRLTAQHDALRLRFAPTETGWRQFHAPPGEGLSVTRVDLSSLPAALQQAALPSAAADVQRSLDLSRGPMARMVSYDFGEARPGRLLLAIHHLLVDGVSWRVLLADLEAIWQGLATGKTVELPAKTTSYQRWAERLVEHARTASLAAESGYWLGAVPPDALRLPVDHAGGCNDVASERTCALFLEPEETRALLQDVPQAYRTQINDVLLAALVTAVSRWTGRPVLAVELEGHGREDLFEDIDLSRTVGWFTCRFPVLLDLSGARDPGAALVAVKEALRSIPAKGIGYGLLRYLGEPEIAGRLRERSEPDIVFNYLGQFDQVLDGSSFLGVATEPCGPLVNPRGARRRALEVVASVMGGRLGVSWIYSRNLHEAATIERLAQDFLDSLREIIRHCAEAGAGGVSPSDFPLADLDQNRLDKVLAAIARRERQT